MASYKLADAEPWLASIYVEARRLYIVQYPERDVMVTCTWRSPEEQAVLFAQGRTTPGQIVTQIDGTSKMSNHNHRPSRAIDFAITVGGKITWDEKLYFPMGEIAAQLGAVWGGHWKTFKDYPHLELPA